MLCCYEVRLSQAWTMQHKKAHKPRFHLFGYGVLALYVAGIIAAGAGVYGFNLTSLVVGQSSSDQARAQTRTGRMLLTTEDRVQCRSIHFNNETQELSSETLTDCAARPTGTGGGERGSGGSFSVFHDGFVNR
jgi:hypothetical protein